MSLLFRNGNESIAYQSISVQLKFKTHEELKKMKRTEMEGWLLKQR